jgi:serine/threonine protein kinase/tetratricopeptide (TPR) repeat protein
MEHGARLGRYEILDLVGRGGMGEVYRARDTRLNRIVAIKTLPPQLTGDADARARFEREARSVAALSHPNILAIHDVGDADGVLFVVTELLHGMTLAARLGAGALPPETAREYALQVARGLAAAHAKSILHRDLKPANVFVTQEDQLKILDFGLAVMRGASLGEDDETCADFRTGPAAFLGTPAYMSPEQMRDQDVDHRSDIFAFGAVLYEMLGGEGPFNGPSVADIVTAVLTSEPRRLEPQTPLGSRLERIALRCLAKHPAQRPQSVEEVIGALTEAGASGTFSNVVPTPTLRPTPRSSVAVLPFADLSPEQHLGYLCDGVADEITSGLSRISGLRVAARTSAFQFKGKADDVRRIGQALGVDAVLEGSIRAAGTRLRVTTQLVNVSDGYYLWSERFDREAGDVFAVEDEISNAVVAALRGQFAGLDGGELLARGTRDLEAYTLYLKGRYHWNKRTEEGLRVAATLFQSAIDRDPAYGPAYGALADVFVTLGMYGAARSSDVMPKAKAAALQALAIATTVKGTQATLGTVAAMYDWDWSLAERLFTRAVETDRDHPTTHHWYATHYLLPQRRFRQADQALSRALELDPLSLIISVSLGLASFLGRNYDEAVRRFEATLALDGGFAMGHFFLGQTLTEMGRYRDAVSALERAIALTGGSPDMKASLGYAHARAGDEGAARRVLEDLSALASERYVSPVLPVHVHIGLGEIDTAMQVLERAEAVRAADLVWIGVRPVFDPLRDLPRFTALCERVGVPSARF